MVTVTQGVCLARIGMTLGNVHPATMVGWGWARFPAVGAMRVMRVRLSVPRP